MNTLQLYDQLDAIENALLKLERAVPFGQEPDIQIIANLHVTLAADLPGLISRVEQKLTLDGYDLTMKVFVEFERRIATCNFDGTASGHKYTELSLRTRELFTDILAVYSHEGLGSGHNDPR